VGDYDTTPGDITLDFDSTSRSFYRELNYDISVLNPQGTYLDGQNFEIIVQQDNT
jgi:hypothetical protein